MFSSTIGPLLYGFALLLLFFLLMNADRRFREHVVRSLTRPFNFFADLRDRRLLPNAQTTLLAVILSGSAALCTGSLLRHAYAVATTDSALGQMLPSGFRSRSLASDGSYLGLVLWLSVFAFAAMIATVLVLRFVAIFRKGRIMMGDTFNLAVWAMLPVVLLLPFDLILPRMDATPTTVKLVCGGIVVLFLWVYYRLLKGIGVLFDVYPSRLYIYGTLGLALLTAVATGYLRSLH